MIMIGRRSEPVKAVGGGNSVAASEFEQLM